MHYPHHDFLRTVSRIFSFIICTISKEEKEEGRVNRGAKRTLGTLEGGRTEK